MSITNTLENTEQNNGNGPVTSWFRLAYVYGIPAVLLVYLVILGATTFATDLREVKAGVTANSVKIDDLNRHLEVLVKINRQACVNTSNGDRLAIAGCMVSE